jgi:hypothetical protein
MKQVTRKELKEKRARERYSVDYYTVYNKELLDKAMDGLFEEDKTICIPVLLNSHSFQRTDMNAEHKTTYEKVPKPNPKFSGKSLFETIQGYDSYFCDEYDKSYLFDGDTLEFVTQDFYKTTVDAVMKELRDIESEFIQRLNKIPFEGVFKTYSPFQICKQNYPFASYLTNLRSNAMFNNGTYHINITLPTRLDSSGNIVDFELFRRQHQNFARALQWLSPLMIALYGSKDPLSESSVCGDRYSLASQRVAVSRYIGLGTYDTDTMETGKILTKPVEELCGIDWYHSFHEKTDYVFLKELGLDINFNKHYSHGIEFRILDSLPYDDLQNIMKYVVYLADLSLNVDFQNPKKMAFWHKITEECILHGRGYLMDVYEQNKLFSVFRMKCMSKEPQYISDVFYMIVRYLEEESKGGLCYNAMLLGEGAATQMVKSEGENVVRDTEEAQEVQGAQEVLLNITENITNNIDNITNNTIDVVTDVLDKKEVHVSKLWKIINKFLCRS